MEEGRSVGEGERCSGEGDTSALMSHPCCCHDCATTSASLVAKLIPTTTTIPMAADYHGCHSDANCRSSLSSNVSNHSLDSQLLSCLRLDAACPCVRGTMGSKGLCGVYLYVCIYLCMYIYTSRSTVYLFVCTITCVPISIHIIMRKIHVIRP